MMLDTFTALDDKAESGASLDNWVSNIVADSVGNIWVDVYKRQPLYEQKLNKSAMRVMILNNDTPFNDFGGSNANMICLLYTSRCV